MKSKYLFFIGRPAWVLGVLEINEDLWWGQRMAGTEMRDMLAEWGPGKGPKAGVSVLGQLEEGPEGKGRRIPSERLPH